MLEQLLVGFAGLAVLGVLATVIERMIVRGSPLHRFSGCGAQDGGCATRCTMPAAQPEDQRHDGDEHATGRA